MKGGRSGRANRKRVATWPTYLLTNIPESERQRLSLSAAAQNISVADIIRRLLCARYRLHCPPESYRASELTGPNILLRLQPKLKRALDADAKNSERSLRSIILEEIQKGDT